MPPLPTLDHSSGYYSIALEYEAACFLWSSVPLQITSDYTKF